MPNQSSKEALTVVSSPRITALVDTLSADMDEGIDAFWQEIEADGAPIIEDVDVESGLCIVTFLWRATDDLQQVLLLVDTLTDQYRRSDLSSCFMKPIEGTNVWHISYRLPNNLRATYHFCPVSTSQMPLSTGAKSREEWLDILSRSLPDAFNPKTFPARRNREPNSVLELPDAPEHRWWQIRADVPQGTLTEHCLQSEVLGNERNIWIYTPANYIPEQSYPILILLDGQVWVQNASIQATLDNLIASGEIPPMIAVAIDSLDTDIRSHELPCNPQFVQFLIDELLVWVGERWTITDDPARTIISGQSFGGLASAYAGFYASHRFGNILSQSGSFWWKTDDPVSEDYEWLTHQFAIGEKHPLRFYVAVGLQEWMLLVQNRHLRDVLIAKGYELTYHEFNGGHDYICWRGDIAEGLIALTNQWE